MYKKRQSTQRGLQKQALPSRDLTVHGRAQSNFSPKSQGRIELHGHHCQENGHTLVTHGYNMKPKQPPDQRKEPLII